MILTYAMRSKVPTLYFSADSDSYTQAHRMLSIAKGIPLHESAEIVRSGDLGAYTDVYTQIPIRFNYISSPGLGDIERLIEAYDAVYGVYPELIVIDNVTNIVGAGGDDDKSAAAQDALMDYCHDMSRGTSASVVALHHVTGTYNDGNKPIPLSGVKNQITRVPELVLSMYRDRAEFGPDTLHVAAVKNRFGKPDPSGMDTAELEWIGETMQIRDFAYA